ncbi:MAG: phosphopantetheine-binding protein [Chitinophagaceae bacterium]|jgi:acyl carrier protein|nr:acyl carrier protein [Chitinophagaceae bacterium]
MNQKLLEIINSIRVAKGFGILQEINPSDHLRNDLGFDSFDLAELTVHIEDAFNVDVFENGIVNTVEEILEILKKQ